MDKYVEDPTTVTNSSFWALISESNKLILDLLQYTTIDWILRTRSESGTNTNSANTNSANTSTNTNTNTNTNTSTNTSTNANVNVDHLKVASLRYRLTRIKEKLELDGTRKNFSRSIERRRCYYAGVLGSILTCTLSGRTL